MWHIIYMICKSAQYLYTCLAFIYMARIYIHASFLDASLVFACDCLIYRDRIYFHLRNDMRSPHKGVLPTSTPLETLALYNRGPVQGFYVI